MSMDPHPASSDAAPRGGPAPAEPAGGESDPAVVAAALEPWTPDVALAPAPDPAREPDGFVVTADDATRIHFLDWGAPGGADSGPGILLVPGLVQPASAWAPVARRLAVLRRVVVADIRGQGLSDSPMDGYGLGSLGRDLVAVAEGSGLVADGPVVLAGLGFGAVIAAGAATEARSGGLGERCAALVLVDGGWERLEAVTDLDVDEFLRGLDEPPEILRTMDAFLADRRAFDPATWDRDQERAARDSVVETAAGHVVRAVRPHVVDALVRTMFTWDPAAPGGGLAAVPAPVTALVALGSGDPDLRLGELRRSAVARLAGGRGPIRVSGFPGLGHNLPRYRPADVAAAILEAG